MTTGIVGNSGRATSAVAPNSPMEMAKANAAATNIARPTMGKSTSRQTRQGDAPITAAAPRNDGRMPRSTGSKLRTTNGNATSVCASGKSAGDARKSSGGLSSAMMYPKPSVTADVPSGSMNNGSSMAAHRPVPRAR